MPKGSDEEQDIFEDMRDEVLAMAKQGMKHPSTPPVLGGAALGAIAAGVIPFVAWPVGLVLGAGFMLYQRVKK